MHFFDVTGSLGGELDLTVAGHVFNAFCVNAEEHVVVFGNVYGVSGSSSTYNNSAGFAFSGESVGVGGNVFFKYNFLTEFGCERREVVFVGTECDVVNAGEVVAVGECVYAEVVNCFVVNHTAGRTCGVEVDYPFVPALFEGHGVEVPVSFEVIAAAGRGKFDLTVADVVIGVFHVETNIHVVIVIYVDGFVELDIDAESACSTLSTLHVSAAVLEHNEFCVCSYCENSNHSNRKNEHRELFHDFSPFFEKYSNYVSMEYPSDFGGYLCILVNIIHPTFWFVNVYCKKF